MSTAAGNSGKIGARVVGHGPVRIWGLSSRERLRRQLNAAGVSLEASPKEAHARTVVIVHAGYVYDQRIITALVSQPGVILEADCDGERRAVAAHVDVRLAPAVEGLLQGQPATRDLAPLRPITVELLCGNYVEELLKSEAPILLPISAQRQAVIERRLFDGSYKGVTDAVTKYVWPLPARWAVRLCVAAGIRPNHVTLAGLALAVAATGLFAMGWHGSGLLLAWVMTFFDTVDGKLARVTIDLSRFGHVLDKGVDIVHPPFWYIAWGMGLRPELAFCGDGLVLLYAIVGGYVAGRLAEGAFTLFLGGFSMFTWRPFDSRFRLVLARRNPCLVVLTVGYLAGRPDAGLLAVALWTVVSGLVLLVRLIQAFYRRLTGGPLRPWLEGPAPVGSGADLRRIESTSGRGAIS